MTLAVTPILMEWVALQVRRPRTRGFVIFGDPVVVAVVVGVVSIILLIWGLNNRSAQKRQEAQNALDNRSAHERREAQIQALYERMVALPNEIQDQIFDRAERYAAVVLPPTLDPGQRNDAARQFLEHQIATATVEWREESLRMERRFELLYARIAALPEKTCRKVRKQMDELVRPTSSNDVVSWDSKVLLEKFGSLLATLAEIGIHVPASRSSRLRERFNALPNDASTRIATRMTPFVNQILHSIASPERRGLVWERLFMRLLTEAEARNAPAPEGRLPR